MSTRRSHYEIAFEKYLDRRGTPYVAVEDVRHHVKTRLGAKAFDYIVYPPTGPACLVDVKGRKVVRAGLDGDCRHKNWVTRADVRDMQAWQKVFGPDFTAVFAFGYWISGGATGLFDQDAFALAGRRYSFWLAPVNEYALHSKQLSKSWDTVSIPKEVFLRISRKLEQCWEAAPC